LWTTIMSKFEGEFPTEYPPSADVLTAVLKKFPTKQQLEEAWNKENSEMLFNKLMSLDIVLVVLPKDLWTIVSGYAISWTDIEDLMIPTD
jgi:hypothetical protein